MCLLCVAASRAPTHLRVCCMSFTCVLHVLCMCGCMRSACLLYQLCMCVLYHLCVFVDELCVFDARVLCVLHELCMFVLCPQTVFCLTRHAAHTRRTQSHVGVMCCICSMLVSVHVMRTRLLMPHAACPPQTPLGPLDSAALSSFAGTTKPSPLPLAKCVAHTQTDQAAGTTKPSPLPPQTHIRTHHCLNV